MLTVKQAADRLGVRPSNVYTMVESGLIGYHRIRSRPGVRGTIRFSEEQIAVYLQATSAGGTPTKASPRQLKHIMLTE
jgi:excisionase family DNA binding protein